MWWINISPGPSPLFSKRIHSDLGKQLGQSVPGMVWANIKKKQTWGTDLILNWPCLKRRLFNKSLLRRISSHLKFKFSQVSVMRFVVKSSQMILSIWNKKWFHHRSSCPRSKLPMNTWKTIQFPWDVCFLPLVLTYLPLAKILKMYPSLEPQSGFWKLWRIHNWWWKQIIWGKYTPKPKTSDQHGGKGRKDLASFWGKDRFSVVNLLFGGFYKTSPTFNSSWFKRFLYTFISELKAVLRTWVWNSETLRKFL